MEIIFRKAALAVPAIFLLAFGSCQGKKPQPLFNGKNLAGWYTLLRMMSTKITGSSRSSNGEKLLIPPDLKMPVIVAYCYIRKVKMATHTAFG